MPVNMGNVDRVIRIVVGVLIILWGWMTGNWLGIIGLVLVATAVVGFCPTYKIFGISTCKTPK